MEVHPIAKQTEKNYPIKLGSPSVFLLGEKTPSSRSVKGVSPMSREGMNRLSVGKVLVDKGTYILLK